MKNVYIVAAVRTPIGSFNGMLSGISATKLGAIAIKAALQKAGIAPENIQEVFMGNVISANLGQAPARQAAIFAGLPENVICTTINKVCASGMKAVMFGAQSIMLGINDIVVAGGMESMSNVPYYLEKARNGYKLGHGQLTDGLLKDALWDVYNDFHMGSAAELIVKEMNISREMQDEYAINSYKRAKNAWEENLFKDEVIPVEVLKGKEMITIAEDEEYKNVNFDKIPLLKPVFDKNGSVTAANSSTLNDGAAALILVSEAKLKELNLKPLARIVSFSDAAQAPQYFTTSPSLAIPKALNLAGISKKDIASFEINEAFAAVAIANTIKLDLDQSKVNILGGAVSLGHPLGASGARIICTLLSSLTHVKGNMGVAGICNGGGGASAIVVEKLN